MHRAQTEWHVASAVRRTAHVAAVRARGDECGCSAYDARMCTEQARRAAVIFDLDGTLTKPYLDFDVIRRDIGIVDGPILEAMVELNEVDRARAQRILDRYEQEAAENATLQEGACETVRDLRRGGYPVAILTRNARRWVDLILGHFGIVVDAIRTREDGAIKPSGVPVTSICHELGAAPERSWMVGDYLFDILSGKEAGARTVLMLGDRDVPEFAARADHVIRRLDELPAIIGSRV